MHELTIARLLVEAAEEEARRHRAVAVTRIDCCIGRLRQVDGLLLQEAFDVARRGSLASGAALRMTSVGMSMACKNCGHAEDLEDWRFDCPRCGSNDVALSGGDELELTSLGLAVDNEN